MSNELDFEIIDENDDSTENENETNEATSTSDDKSKKEEATDTSPAKSNKSNFKKINKLNKALIAENKRLKEKLSTKKTFSDDGVESDDFDDDDVSFDRNEFRFFLIENPEAKEYSKEIENTINIYPNLTFEDALALAKAKQPKKSQSSDDFSTKSVNTKVRKRLSELTEEEALKLDNSKYLEWARTTGKIK